MKFKFPFFGVIRHRTLVRGSAQKEYSDAQNAADEKLREIQKCFERIDDARQSISKVQKQGHQQAPQMQLLEEMIEGQKKVLENLRKEARQLLMVAEEKREVLLEATKELKAIENYKDKKFQEFRVAKRKHEIKQIDEIVTLRFQKRGTE